MNHDSNREELVIELYNGASYEEQPESNVRRKEKLHPHIVASFESQILRIDLQSLDFDLADEDLFKRSYEMMSLHQLKIATDSLDKMADLERNEIVKYGKRGVRYFSDSLLLLEPANSTPHFLSTLTRVERNNTFSKAKELSRSQMKGIENALEKVNGRN